MRKLSSADALGYAALVTTFILIVLDKIGKLKGSALLILMVLAALATIPLARGNHWAMSANSQANKRSRANLCSVGVLLVYLGLGIWVHLTAQASASCNDDPRRTTERIANFIVEWKLHVPASVSERLIRSQTVDTQTALNQIFCLGPFRTSFAFVLVPGEAPIMTEHLSVLVLGSGPPGACNPVVTLQGTDANPAIQITTNIKAHDAETVTFGTEIFGYNLLPTAANGPAKTFVMSDFGRPLPADKRLMDTPPLFGEARFFFPATGMPYEQKFQFFDSIQKAAFTSIDITVSPNPAEGRLASAWSLTSEAPTFDKFGFGATDDVRVTFKRDMNDACE